MHRSQNLPFTRSLIDGEISMFGDIRMYEEPNYCEFCLLSCSWEVIHADIPEAMADGATVGCESCTTATANEKHLACMYGCVSK